MSDLNLLMFFFSPWIIFLALGFIVLILLDKKVIKSENSKSFFPYLIVIIELLVFILVQFGIFPFFISKLYFARFIDGLSRQYLITEWLLIVSVVLFVFWGIQVKSFYNLSYKETLKVACTLEIIPTMVIILFLAFTSSGWIGF